MIALRVAFAGTPEFARTALQGILSSRHRVVGVLTRQDRPRGRGQRLTASPVKEQALAAHLPLAQPATLDAAALQQLTSWRADLLVVVAYGLILPQGLLDAAALGSINVHASLLPRWRGAAPIQRALLAGDTHTGITLMRMQAALDAGPILLQRSIRIDPTDTSGSLHERLARLGTETLLAGLDALADARLPGAPQPLEGVSYAPKISKSEALIDWGRPAVAIDRQVRAFNPYPMALTRFEEGPLRILAAHVHEEAAHPASPPGTIIDVLADAILVQCSTGSLALTQVQLPGRRGVAAHAFALGRALQGQRLG